jgi:hypothetical protein
MFSKVLIYRILIVYKSLIFLFFLIEGIIHMGDVMYVTSPACKFHAPSFEPTLSFL